LEFIDKKELEEMILKTISYKEKNHYSKENFIEFKKRIENHEIK